MFYSRFIDLLHHFRAMALATIAFFAATSCLFCAAFITFSVSAITTFSHCHSSPTLLKILNFIIKNHIYIIMYEQLTRSEDNCEKNSSSYRDDEDESEDYTKKKPPFLFSGAFSLPISFLSGHERTPRVKIVQYGVRLFY